MKKHVPKWLNDAALLGLGSRYEGVIDAVVEERVRNLFKRDESTGKPREEVQPVIEFTDGSRIVSNWLNM